MQQMDLKHNYSVGQLHLYIMLINLIKYLHNILVIFTLHVHCVLDMAFNWLLLYKNTFVIILIYIEHLINYKP